MVQTGPVEKPRFVRTKKRRHEAAILLDIRSCYVGLEPHIMHRDGSTLTIPCPKHTSDRLNARLKSLFRELGRFASQEEVASL